MEVDASGVIQILAARIGALEVDKAMLQLQVQILSNPEQAQQAEPPAEPPAPGVHKASEDHL